MYQTQRMKNFHRGMLGQHVHIRVHVYGYVRVHA